ncbi:MAG TPA: DUF3891 family protein [Thermoanaerobaculia bacterium]|nr:DUF3891 family protein [Thermoanaerobaculia bacterium]
MIVVESETSFLLITQPDHAHFSGELLGLWWADGIPEHPRRSDLVFAAREHDNGWRETDAAPRWDRERNRPYDFLTTSREERIEIWQRGTARFAGERPYAALLITHHALQLHRDRRDLEGWGDFLEYLEELEQGLIEATGAAPEELAADYRLLDLADLISLAACNQWSQPFGRSFGSQGVRGSFRDGTVFLDPLPLAGATTFQVPCRRIPRRVYSGDADLGGELATARWQEMKVRVAALSSGP